MQTYVLWVRYVMYKNKRKELLEWSYKNLRAQNEAFANAGITYGTVEYTCPHCGGKAYSTRYKQGNYVAGGGSCENGCFVSMIWSTIREVDIMCGKLNCLTKAKYGGWCNE